jgi:hypothetical protein
LKTKLAKVIGWSCETESALGILGLRTTKLELK